jgi:hypothetical protein
MKTDSLFDEIFQTQPELLFELLGQNETAMGDYDIPRYIDARYPIGLVEPL